MFETLSRNTKEMIIISGDDDNLSHCRFDKPIRFSIDTRSEYQAKAIEYQSFQHNLSTPWCKLQTFSPGEIQSIQCPACIALLSEMGVKLKDMR